MITQEELATARSEFIKSHEAVLASEDEETFAPSEAAKVGTEAARKWRGETYPVYLKLREAVKQQLASKD